MHIKRRQEWAMGQKNPQIQTEKWQVSLKRHQKIFKKETTNQTFWLIRSCALIVSQWKMGYVVSLISRKRHSESVLFQILVIASTHINVLAHTIHHNSQNTQFSSKYVLIRQHCTAVAKEVTTVTCNYFSVYEEVQLVLSYHKLHNRFCLCIFCHSL